MAIALPRTGSSGKGWLVFVLGERALQVSPGKIHKNEFAELREQQRLVPVYIVTLNGLNYWQFQEHVFSDDHGLVAEQVYAELVGLASDEDRATGSPERRPTQSALSHRTAPGRRWP